MLPSRENAALCSLQYLTPPFSSNKQISEIWCFSLLHTMCWVHFWLCLLPCARSNFRKVLLSVHAWMLWCSLPVLLERKTMYYLERASNPTAVSTELESSCGIGCACRKTMRTPFPTHKLVFIKTKREWWKWNEMKAYFRPGVHSFLKWVKCDREVEMKSMWGRKSSNTLFVFGC